MSQVGHGQVRQAEGLAIGGHRFRPFRGLRQGDAEVEVSAGKLTVKGHGLPKLLLGKVGSLKLGEHHPERVTIQGGRWVQRDGLPERSKRLGRLPLVEVLDPTLECGARLQPLDLGGLSGRQAPAKPDQGGEDNRGNAHR